MKLLVFRRDCNAPVCEIETTEYPRDEYEFAALHGGDFIQSKEVDEDE